MTREEKEQTGKYVLQMARLLEDGCYQQEMLLKAVHIIDEALEQEPRKDEVILTKEEYGELVSSEFDNGYAEGYREALEQEPILDKIRAELIQLIQNGTLKIESGNEELFRIIDKYKAESEEE